MISRRCTVLLLSLIFCSLTGCAGLKQLSQIPQDYQVHEITAADPGAPFAISRSGAIATVSGKNIDLMKVGGVISTIDKGTATQLCFSPDGQKLAAALPFEKSTILRVYDGNGNTLGETTVSEYVTSLAWRSDNELLATALKVKKYKFGVELISLLYGWDGVKAPTVTTLNAVTVRPQVAQIPEQTLLTTLKMGVSPLGDEITYTALKDPPMFTPYLRVIARHLESGAEHEVGKSALGSGPPVYTPDSESVLVPDLQSLTRRISIPDGREMNAWPAPGTYPAISPSGAFVFLDGRLYHEGKGVATFPTRSRASFLQDGSGLALSYDGKLYYIYGPRDQGVASQPKDPQRLLQLRRLRSLGLIDEKEYRGSTLR